jgi:hypothetical protein
VISTADHREPDLQKKMVFYKTHPEKQNRKTTKMQIRTARKGG